MNKIMQFILVTLILQDLLVVNIPIFTYEDELLMVIGFIYSIFLILIKPKKFKLSRYEIVAFVALIIYVILGVISNFMLNFISIKFAILSIIMTIKGYLLYFEFRIILQNFRVNIDLIKNISKFLKCILVIFTILGLINLKFNFFVERGMRFGIKTTSIGFSHPTELAFFSIISMSFILFYNNWANRKKGDLTTIVCTSIIVFLSGRSKAIAFMAIFVVLYYFAKIVKKFRIKYFICLTPVLVYIGLPRIISELLEGARGHLYRTGIKIAVDYFPLGSGFGTFGSYISRLYYSPIYFQYGINNVWGLSPSMPLYIADTYWAMVLGENGFIGLALIIMILYFIFIQFIKIRFDYKSKITIFGFIMYTIIASIAEPIYSSNKSAALFVTLAVFITIIKNNKSIKEDKYEKQNC